MRTEQLNGHMVKLYDGVDEMPVGRFQRFNKCLLYDTGIGSDFADVDAHMSRIAAYIPKDPAKALQELENMRNNLYYIVQGVSPRNMAFAALVTEIDGRPRNDLSDAGLNETLDLLNDVKHTLISRLTEAIKKKIREDLSVYFPATFSDVHEKDTTERLLRRTRLILSEITTSQDATEDIARIDDFILMQNPPQSYSTAKGADVMFDKNYTEITLLVSKSMKMDARNMTVLEFYQALAYMKSEARKLRKRVN